MGSYMESGGCFGSSSTVQVSRNSAFHETKVSDVKPGDLVKVVGAKRFGNQGQNVAKVRCVVMYPCDPSIPLIGLPGGCLLTKSHPVRIDGVWRKPQDIGIPAANPSDHVWNFVLEVNHILLVNGMECCTLGHGFQEEGVFHEYWGSRVLDDLAKLPGWAQGRVMAFSQKGPDGHTMKLSANPQMQALFSQSTLSEVCVVCMNAAAEWACVPCGHKCGCSVCLEAIRSTSGTCPICRVDIQNVIKIHNSGHVGEDSVPASLFSTLDLHSDGNAPSLPSVAALTASALAGSASVPEPCLQVLPSACEGSASVLVRVMIPECAAYRPPRDICCVVDISGSMSSHASIQDRNDPSIRQEDGLIVLDIVKHALKTIILSLSPSDRLSIIAFDQAADLILPLCYLDPVSIRRAIDGVEALRPRGQTNLWGGMLQGFESLRRGSALDDSPRSKTVTPPFALYNCFIVFCSSAANGSVSCTDFPAASCSD